jgi:hypothetical protein
MSMWGLRRLAAALRSGETTAGSLVEQAAWSNRRWSARIDRNRFLPRSIPGW